MEEKEYEQMNLIIGGLRESFAETDTLRELLRRLDTDEGKDALISAAKRKLEMVLDSRLKEENEQ